jgi:putative signal transducing protein
MTAPLSGQGDDGELVALAFVKDEIEGEMLRGLLESVGIPSMVRSAGVDGRSIAQPLLNPEGGPGHLLVRAEHAEEARTLLAETLVEDEEAAWPEPANARYLEEAAGGRKPRAYGLIGAYARIYAVSLVAMAAMFGAYLLYRAV